MISAHIVELATEYLDQCAATNQQPTLVGVHWHIDGRNKSLPLLEEINEALLQRPLVYVQRAGGTVTFSDSGIERTISAADMKQADKQYRREFATALGALQQNDL